MALIALFARVTRSTNRSTPEALRPVILLLCVTSPWASHSFGDGRAEKLKAFIRKSEHGNPNEVSPATQVAARWPPSASRAARPSSARPQSPDGDAQ